VWEEKDSRPQGTLVEETPFDWRGEMRRDGREALLRADRRKGPADRKRTGEAHG
jgi:hypothetical protein